MKRRNVEEVRMSGLCWQSQRRWGWVLSASLLVSATACSGESEESTRIGGPDANRPDTEVPDMSLSDTRLADTEGADIGTRPDVSSPDATGQDMNMMNPPDMNMMNPPDMNMMNPPDMNMMNPPDMNIMNPPDMGTPDMNMADMRRPGIFGHLHPLVAESFEEVRYDPEVEKAQP